MTFPSASYPFTELVSAFVALTRTGSESRVKFSPAKSFSVSVKSNPLRSVLPTLVTTIV